MTGTQLGRPVRIQYLQGQTVASRDLRDQLRSLEALQASHNAAVHGSYGVGFGLTVEFEAVRASVNCGLAYDCKGRELVLQQRRSIALPASDRGLQLLVLTHRRYAGGRVPVEAGAALRWVAAPRFRPLCGVPIARAAWQSGRYQEAMGAAPPYLAFRPPRARALARLPMASGIVESGRISWELLPNETGLLVRVDTSAAGFVSDRVLYLASLLWDKPNERFFPPFTSVVQARADGFAVRMLLPRTAALALEVVHGAGLVDEVKVADSEFTLFEKVQFDGGGDLIDGDVVSRLSPLSARAWPLQQIDGATITLVDFAGDSGFDAGDLVVAANVPRVVDVRDIKTLHPVTASSSSALAGIGPGDVVLRQGGTAPGSASRVWANSGRTLWLETEVTGLGAGDTLAPLRQPQKIQKVSGSDELIGFEESFVPTVGWGVVRVKDVNGDQTAIAEQMPSRVDSISEAGETKLDPLLGVQVKETLGFANFDSDAFEATSVGPQIRAFKVDRSELFVTGDLVRTEGRHETAFVIEKKGEWVLLSAPLDQGRLEVADISARTTVSAAQSFPTGPWAGTAVRVGTPGLLKRNDVVVVMGKPGNLATVVVSTLSLGGADTYLLAAVDGIEVGDVLGVATFARSAVVTSLVGGAEQRPVVNASGIFAVGDTVALAGPLSVTSLTVVDAAQGASLVLRDALPGIAAGERLELVSLRRACLVKEVRGSQLTVSPSDAFRPGDLAGRFDGWLDKASSTRLSRPSSKRYVVGRWLDGLLPGDAVGLAAISEAQPQLRFAEGTELGRDQTLRLNGPHAHTGILQSRDATVLGISDQQVTLGIAAGPVALEVRPEHLQVIDLRATRIPSRFAAYATQQGVRIAWYGVQLPPPLEEERYGPRREVVEACPLQAPSAGPCSDASSSPPSSQSSSDCCE